MSGPPTTPRDTTAGVGSAPEQALRALIVCDLVASTALVEKIGDARAAVVFQRHDRAARDLLATHTGLEIDKTDGFLLLFERPLDAVLYALAYHRSLAELSTELEVRLTARVGIHFGEVYLRRNRAEDVARGAKPLEVEGLAKPLAARLMSLAGERQTLLTRAAFDLARRAAVGGTADDRIAWLAHGRYVIKGVEEAVEVFEVGIPGQAPLTAPADSEKVARLPDDESVLGWRPAPDHEIPGRRGWMLERKLGDGGFGEVWLGRQVKTGVGRVYKFCFEAEQVRSLRREVALFRLMRETLGERRDITQILDWQFDEPPFYIESEYSSAGSLPEWATTHGGLAEIAAPMRLELVAQTAEALAAAHSVGVLHKDVKPQNILVATDHEGRPHARLTDFGIGLVTDRSLFTNAGITVHGLTELQPEGAAATSGTRLYLAPELLEGKPATVQADIFALGVVLYQIVVGDFQRALAPGWEREVASELLREDISAAVDRDPHRRLKSADELAERVRGLDRRRREREDERRTREAAEHAIALLARSRRQRRIGALVALVVAVVVGLFLYGRRTAVEQARLGQQLGREVQQIEAMMRYEELLPLHDMRPAHQRVRQQMQRIEQRMAGLGRASRGPGHYALGRAHLTLGELDEAGTELERAMALGYHTAEVDWALGMVRALQYRDALRAVVRMKDGDAKAARMAEIEASLRDPALELLARGRASDVESAEFVEAFIAFLENRYPEAQRLAKEASERFPWLFEADLLDAEIRLNQAARNRFSLSYDETFQAYSDAADALRRALTKGESNAHGREQLCLLGSYLLEIEFNHFRRYSDQTFAMAEGDCERALVADPDDPEPLQMLAMVYFRRGEQLVELGQDPSSDLSRAVDYGRRAVAADPKQDLGYVGLAAALWKQAQQAEEVGGDPLPLLEEAVGQLAVGASANPASTAIHNTRGVVLLEIAEIERGRGEDATARLDQALAAFDQALAAQPELIYAQTNAAVVLSERAAAAAETGQDPTPALSRALDYLAAAAATNPSYPDTAIRACWVLAQLAGWELGSGLDPSATLARARASCERGVELAPERADARRALAATLYVGAWWLHRSGEDPAPAYRQAAEQLQLAREAAPGDASAWILASNLAVLAARWSKQTVGDPPGHLERARAAAREALERDPRDADAELAAGWADYWSARRGPGSTAVVGGRIAAGLEHARRARELDPLRQEPRLLQGALEVLAAARERDPERRALGRRQGESRMADAVAANASLTQLRNELGPS